MQAGMLQLYFQYQITQIHHHLKEQPYLLELNPTEEAKVSHTPLNQALQEIHRLEEKYYSNLLTIIVSSTETDTL